MTLVCNVPGYSTGMSIWELLELCAVNLVMVMSMIFSRSPVEREHSLPNISYTQPEKHHVFTLTLNMSKLSVFQSISLGLLFNYCCTNGRTGGKSILSSSKWWNYVVYAVDDITNIRHITYFRARKRSDKGWFPLLISCGLKINFSLFLQLINLVIQSC